jgi:malonate transporter and related proteins
MLEILLVVLPVFLLIFAGQLCRRRAFPGEGFWEPAERLTYFVLFPSLLVITLAEADVSRLTVVPAALGTTVAILAMTGLALALRPWLGIGGAAFTSFYQGIVRFNTYIGLSVAFGLWGEAGLAAAAVVLGAVVPLVNLTSIFVLARYGTVAQPTLAGVARQIATNPLILACLAGAVLNLTGVGPPPVVGDMLRILGRAALPIGLLAVGAALDLAAARRAKRVSGLASLLKLAALPALAYGLGLAFGAEGVALSVGVLFAALPTATSAYILARQLGGDAAFMANLCTLQTLLALVTLPLVLAATGS